MKIIMYIVAILVIAVSAMFFRIYQQNSVIPELGVDNGRFKPLKLTPNGVSTQAENTDKQVDVWPAKQDSQQTMQALIKTIDSYGGAEVVQQSDDYLYVVFTTPTMKYKDDVEFWIDEAAKQVHYRSESRAGKKDMGLNRERYNKLSELYMQ